MGREWCFSPVKPLQAAFQPCKAVAVLLPQSGGLLKHGVPGAVRAGLCSVLRLEVAKQSFSSLAGTLSAWLTSRPPRMSGSGRIPHLGSSPAATTTSW